MKIVVVGYTGPGDEAFVIAAHFLLSNGWDAEVEQIEKALESDVTGVGIFDMATRPGAGDALGAIGPETELVVALHLNGMKGQDPDPRPGAMYNACNAMLLPMCKEFHVPLLVVGDQPGNTDELAAMYVENGICLTDYQLLEEA